MLKEIEDASDLARFPLQKLERGKHPYVYFLIMPLFAFSNAGIRVESDFFRLLIEIVGLGIMMGLILRKTLGISIISRLAVWFGLAKLRDEVNWAQIYGAAMLAGIGFTMSLFISELAFEKEILIQEVKSAILLASMLASAAGLLFLRFNKHVIEYVENGKD